MSINRDESLDRDSLVLKHQHSFSESGRGPIPMWDSADPDRAPPPLPLNPGTSSPISRPNTSARIEEAAALITAKARENAERFSKPKDTPGSVSPDKSLIKGAHHKRMQSLQTGTVRDLSNSLERRSPEKGLGRESSFSRTPKVSEYEGSPERNSRDDTPTPSGRESPTRRYLDKPILGENTPPSATMLALQNMRSQSERGDTPLGNITNGTSGRNSSSFDALSSQLLSLTSICTNLQREMTQLSRRSKDNATDLIGLREATNSRDEDIRKSLKDLSTNVSEKILELPHFGGSTLSSFLLDNKAHNATPTREKRAFELPRIPSPNSFSASLDRELAATPSLLASDGAASIALLEKVLREMGTKEGQDKIMQALDEVQETTSKADQLAWDPDMSKKLEDIFKFMKENANSQALVKFDSPRPGPLERVGRDMTPRADDRRSSGAMPPVNNEEMMNLLKSIKGSVAGGGGLTNEVKALVRELRGEVLGMGRELARKLEQAESSKTPDTHGDTHGPGREEIADIVQDGLAELRDHMDTIMQEARQREGQREVAVTSPGDQAAPNPFEKQAMYHAVKTAIAEQLPQHLNQQVVQQGSTLDKEEILASVRQAWEDCKPEIELQNFGLEREEILACLKEGLQSYQKEPTIQEAGASYDEILEAVHKGLQSFQPPPVFDEVFDAVQKGLSSIELPPVEVSNTVTRDDVLSAVRECLQDFDFPTAERSAPSGIDMTRDDVFDVIREGMAEHAVSRGIDLTRDDVFDAVKEGLAERSDSRGIDLTRDDVFDAVKEGMANQAPLTKEIEFNRDDLFDAVRAGLEGAPAPMGDVGQQVLDQMHELITSMRTEFKQYSAANGKDTEQVLDAMKDGLEDLRADIESYVDRASDVTGKDEIIDTVKSGFRAMQDEMEKSMASIPQSRSVDAPELLDAMEKEFNYLRETLTKQMVQQNAPSSDKEEILDAIRDISESDRGSSLTVPVDNSDVAAMVKEELEHLRQTLSSMLVRQGGSLEREDILDAVREGMDAHSLARKGDGAESMLSNTGELLDAFNEGVDGIRADMQKLAERPTVAATVDMGPGLDILDELKEGLNHVRDEIEKLHDGQRQVVEVSSAAKDQDLINSDGNMISTELEGLKVMITQLRIKVEALDMMPPPPPPEPAPNAVTREDIDDLANTIKDVQAGIEAGIAELNAKEMPQAPAAEVNPNAATKDDTDAIETLLRNAKDQLDELDPAQLAKFEHIEALDDVLIKVKESVDAHKDSGATKEHFESIEALVKEVASGVEELQSKMADLQAEQAEDEEKVTKADIQAIETLCLDTKTQIEELNIPDAAALADKTDMETIHEKIKALQEQIEADNELTGQAFDARKTEHGGLATKIDDAKALITELHDELVGKLNGSDEGITDLAKTLEGHNETFGTFATAAGLAEMVELLKENFEKSHGNHDATKLEVEERDAALMVKHEETKAAMAKEIGDHLNEKFNELMIKYDDSQQTAESSRVAQTEATTSTKAVVEDLKVLLDTLGSTVTETCERMSDDAKTVFVRVDETHAKVEGLATDNQTEHLMTRDEIAKTINAAERLEQQLNDHHPAVLSAIRDIADLVGQHYEHSQKSSEEVKSSISGIPSAIPPLLPALPAPQIIERAPPSPPLEMPPMPKEYDDSQVHEKLNSLIEHATSAKDSLSQMDKLDEIHQQVLSAAAEISGMVANQNRLMNEQQEFMSGQQENSMKEANEAAVALEKRTAQKEFVEADIVRLSQEREELATSVASLKQEQADLAGQSKRLTREVGVLETALNMRREEMKAMERKAETLEKKILEGVMDHARSLMISRPPPQGVKRNKAAKEKARDKAMNLKRVPSSASTMTTKTSVRDGPPISIAPSAVSSAVGMALKRRNPLQEGGNSRPNSPYGSLSGKERRILSTSHVTPRPSLHPDQRALVLAPLTTTVNPSNGGLVNLKRSHSVKSNPSSYYGGRKASWAGATSRRTSSIMPDGNKENEVFREEDEHEEDDGASDAGTERRTSFAGTESDLYTVTDSMAYGTGSDVSGTDSGRTVSYASSVAGKVGGEMGQGGLYIGAEEDEGVGEEEEEEGSEVSDTERELDLESPLISHPQTHNLDHDLSAPPTPNENDNTERGILQLLGPPTSSTQYTDETSSSMAREEEEEREMELEELDGLAPLAPPPNMNGLVKFSPPSDSGIGSELPTAALSHQGGMGGGGGYFDGENQDLGV